MNLLSEVVRSDYSAQHWIAGAADDRATTRGVVTDPSTGEVVATIPFADADTVAAAVDAARAAQAQWWATGATRRAELLAVVAGRVRESAPHLALLESVEMGKPLAMAQEDIEGSADLFQMIVASAPAFFSSEADGFGRVVRKPYGVAALVTPWNYPVCQVTDFLGALLVAGNTVVVKPSEKASLSVAALGPLLDVLPAGVVNIVLGDGSAGAALVSNPGVDLVHFTGSVATGRKVGAAAGGRLIPCFLELGGKDALVVDAGVDPAQAAEVAAAGGWLNAGQLCTSIERVYVHRDIADDFVAALVAQADAWPVGPGTDDSSRMGPLVDAAQRDLVHAHVDEARVAGAQVLVGGCPDPGPGFFYPPTVVLNPPDDSRIMREETFGPVIAVRVVDSFEEGIALANAGDYGLTASALTGDPAHIELATELDAGAVTINGGDGNPTDAAFEPARCSGLGRVHLGPRSLESFTRSYAVSIGGAR